MLFICNIFANNSFPLSCTCKTNDTTFPMTPVILVYSFCFWIESNHGTTCYPTLTFMATELMTNVCIMFSWFILKSANWISLGFMIRIKSSLICWLRFFYTIFIRQNFCVSFGTKAYTSETMITLPSHIKINQRFKSDIRKAWWAFCQS